MKNKKLLYILMAIIIPLGYSVLGSNSAGITGNSTSGCSCHGSNLSTTALSITGIPSTGYVLGTTYNLTVTVANSAYTMANARGGFNITCTEGTFLASTGVTVGGPMQITHNGAKSMSAGSVSWNVNWKAPATSSGTMIFHFAGNATNGNNGNSGDQPNYDPFPFVQNVPPATAPTITGISITGITGTTCTANASINANGSSTAANVEYGVTTAYGSNVVMTPTPITGTTATVATGSLTGLTPNTLYHYRVNAINSAGTTNSADDTFRTGTALLIKDFDKNEFSVYPNPANDYVHIQTIPIIKSFNVSIYNLTGSQVIRPSITSQNNTLIIDLAGISKGIYILHATINERQVVHKIRVN